jgi:predicted membrane protein
VLGSSSIPGVSEIILSRVSLLESLLLKHALVIMIRGVIIAFTLTYYLLFLLLGIIYILFQLTTYKQKEHHKLQSLLLNL